MACLEGGLPFITFPDTNIIVAPVNIKFAEQLHALEVFYALGKIGEWGDIFSSDCIKWTVVNDVVLFVTILLGDHKGAESIG